MKDEIRIKNSSFILHPSSFIFYHNPRCGKSRVALELLEEEGIDPVIVLYLKTPLDTKNLWELSGKLGCRPQDLLRKHETLLEELQLDLEDDEAVIRALHEHPILMERPILVHGEKAVIGRPPNRVLELTEKP